ncbi:MAG: hypothetical protein H0W46_04650 [Acidimicrobiia bacterium]|nr:hypothetical protein [Acidimicrobiia bacterium]
MSFLLDANLLVYGAMQAMPEHDRTRAWLADEFTDVDSFVGLAWASLYSFVRLISNPRIMGADAVDLRTAWSAADASERGDRRTGHWARRAGRRVDRDSRPLGQ